MRQIEILPKTFTIIQLAAYNELIQVQNMRGNYLIDISEKVENEMIRRGVNFNDLESVHSVVKAAYEEPKPKAQQ